MKLALRLLIAAAGLALFGWFVWRAGLGEISGAFIQLGRAAPLVLLPFALVYLLDTLGWYFAFGRSGTSGIRFATLLRVRWAGEAVNNVVASAYIGGEAVKVHLLHKRGVPAVIAASSVVAGKTAQILAQVVFIAIGALAAAANLPAGSRAHRGLLAVTGLAFLIATLLFWLQKRGIFTTLLAIAARMRLNFRALNSRAENLRQLDARILDFYRKDRRNFFLSTASYLGGWMADSLEVLLVSHLLGMPLQWNEAIAVEAFISVAKALGIFVPAALGVQESGVVFLFYLLGLPAALGVSYAIIRRGRELVYVLIGGMLLYADGWSFRDRRVAA